MFIPIIFILYNAEKILLQLGQDEAVAPIAATYVWRILPGCMMMALFDANRLFLNALD